MNGNDTFLDVNDAHLRVTSGNVYASAFNLDQIDIVMSSNTASTVNFNNPTKAFNAASNIEVGTANLFVDTTTTRVGVGTASPATTLDVAGDLNVSGNLTIIGTRTTLDTEHLRVKDPIIELGKDNTASPVVDLGLVMTRPSGSSNVGIIFDESESTLEIGYTQGSASDSTITMQTAATEPLSVNVNGTISGNGSGLTALNATNITTGTLAVTRGGTGTTTSTGTGSVVLSNAPTFTGDSAFLHAGSGTPHNSNDLTLRLGGLNSSGSIIQSKCAIIVTPNTTYGGQADYGRNAIHFCTRNTQDNTNATLSNAKISILPNGNVGFSHPNPDKRIHVRTFSNSILAGLDHVTTSGSSGNDEYVGLGFGATSGSQSNRIFKGGIFFNRKGGDTGRGDLLFCIENTQDNTTEVSPANAIMRIARNSDVSITGGFSVSGNATFDTDTLFVDSTNNRVGIGTTSPSNKLHIEGHSNSAILKRDSGAATNTYNYIINAPRPGTTSAGAVLFINGSTRTHDGDTNTLTIRNDSGSIDVGTRTETLVSSHSPAPETYNANQKNVDILLNNGSIWMSPYTGRHRNLGTSTNTWSQYIGKHYLGRILSGLEIENKNTNSAGATGYYSNLLHFRAHDHSIYGGNVGDRTMTLRGDKVGIRTETPGYTLEVNGSLFYSSGGLNGSDDRIKYNEENITNALDIIDKLTPQKYEKIMTFPSNAKGTWIPTDENWETVKNAETKPWEGFQYGDEFGFIAQDVRNIPEVSFLVSGSESITGDENISPKEYNELNDEERSSYTQKFIYESNVITLQEYTSLTLENREKYTELYSKRVETQTPLGLNYQGIFVVAVKAIQELKSENETLKTQLTSVLARLDALESA